MKFEYDNNLMKILEIEDDGQNTSVLVTEKNGTLVFVPDTERCIPLLVEWEATKRDGTVYRWREVIVIGGYDEPSEVLSKAWKWLSTSKLIGYVRLDEVSIPESES